MFDVENESECGGVQHLQCATRWQIYKSIKDLTHFALAFAINEILAF